MHVFEENDRKIYSSFEKIQYNLMMSQNSRYLSKMLFSV